MVTLSRRGQHEVGSSSGSASQRDEGNTASGVRT
jgi:hypothetical protein